MLHRLNGSQNGPADSLFDPPPRSADAIAAEAGEPSRLRRGSAAYDLDRLHFLNGRA